MALYTPTRVFWPGDVGYCPIVSDSQLQRDKDLDNGCKKRISHILSGEALAEARVDGSKKVHLPLLHCFGTAGGRLPDCEIGGPLHLAVVLDLDRAIRTGSSPEVREYSRTVRRELNMFCETHLGLHNAFNRKFFGEKAKEVYEELRRMKKRRFRAYMRKNKKPE